MTICDGCGKERSIYRTQEVVVCGEVDDHFGFCFLCVKEDERAEARRCPCGGPKRCADPSTCEHNR